MLIIDDNVEYITQHIWATSDSVKNLPCEFGAFEKESLSLDPGGMYCMKIPHKNFIIDGYNFDVQISRIEEVLYCMDRGKERIPGYIRFPMWRWLVIMPKETFVKVRQFLIDLEKSDEALHAELTEKEIKSSLYASGAIIKFSIKDENLSNIDETENQ